ncbi:hypothetical protein [Roseomonas marmotae]|uniref:Uncharacterized protein n=1 Tax=Roseomonas marmotae TaxID=2768161 RepID=A0ABS3KGE5_9PROT|nr:hypothetical protein [Roseomonas marmotae]MBO1076539.1 hypothetical protein [Roseomonas marmotae]QTI81845.1 hypothetical protein IAI58_21090 [Roseomonas marmotae]
MQHHRSIGTATLVALMAAHREAQGGTNRRQEDDLPPLDPREADRIVHCLWRGKAAPADSPPACPPSS